VDAPTPPRMTIGSLDTGVTLNAMYNPDDWEDTLAAAYQKIKVQGLSHQVLQFEHTENWTATFKLAFDALSASTQRGISSDIVASRNWLQSLVYPKRGAGSIAQGAPTRVILFWPGMVSLVAVVTKLKFENKRFSWTGLNLAATWFICSITIEEIRDTRLFSDQVAATGTIRTST
jgi:hypothetical protein